MTYEFDLPAAEASRRKATTTDASSMSGDIGENQIDKAMREASGAASLTERVMRATTASEDYMRSALGGFGSGEAITSGTSVDKAMRDAASEHQRVMDGVLGRSGSLADAVGNLKGLRGIDDGILAGIKGQVGRYDTATLILEQELAKAKRHDPVGFYDEDVFGRSGPPPLPPMPRNPILKTNELLDEVIGGLSDQRAVIEASAEAQKQETKLIAELVDAFVTSQAASDEHARRSQVQAWIGIGVAVASAAIPLILLLADKVF